MRPEEYDIMVEKLADEIIGDVFEKEAAANCARKKGDKEEVSKQKMICRRNKNECLKKQYAYNKAKDAIRKEREEKTAEEMIMEYAFEKEAATTAKQVAKQEKAYHKERQKAYNDVFKSTNKEDLKNGYRFDYGKAMKDAAGKSINFIKKHPYGTAATVAIPTAAGVGLVAYKRHKKKEEEAKEKVAAYWEDAIMWKEAAENVWDYASECEDEYDAVLLKNAAEEVFDEAEAQAQAAENIFEAIENGELDVVGDADIIDNEEFDEDYE